MTDVIALSNFDHNGSRKRNSQFSVSEPTAKALAQKGLVRIVKGKKKPADGKKSSASPAGQASTKKTAKKSDDGEKGAKTEALL